jgi:WD40 repeat protein
MARHNPPPALQRGHRKTISIHHIVLIICIVVILGIIVAAIVIVKSEGISAPLVTLISTVVAMITGVLGVMVGILQWHAARNPSPSDSHTPLVEGPLVSHNLPPVTPMAVNIAVPMATDSPVPPERNPPSQTPIQKRREEWGFSPHVSNFYGRETEQNMLKQWIITDHCRVVALLGMGGIGKSSLAAKLAETLKDNFQSIYWKSLYDAPSLEDTLKKYLNFLLNYQADEIPEKMEEQIDLLLQHLRASRCLLIFDNLESIMEEGTTAGRYKQGYEAYGQLIHRLGETNHQSCLLITSRETPREIEHMASKTDPVRRLPLTGLSVDAGESLLRDKDLSGSDEILKELIHLYAGNPLSLKLVAEHIQSLFGGNVASVLEEDSVHLIENVHDVIDEQFARLSPLERSIMYWLAIGREEGASLKNLKDDMIETTSRDELPGALISLRRRSLIEPSNGSRFILQPVISEYVTEQLIQRARNEFVDEIPDLLASHALINVQSEDYVRNSQFRVILKPLNDKLRQTYTRENIEAKAKRMLHKQQEENRPLKPDYTVGNLINLLSFIQSNLEGSEHSDLSGYDFSHLSVRQAYLQNAILIDANFAYAHLEKTAFAATLCGIFSLVISPDGKELAAAGIKGEIWQWEIEPPSPLTTCADNITGHIFSVAISSDDRLLASGGEDRTVRIWDRKTGHCLLRLQGHSARIWSVVFSPDNRLLISAGHDQTIRIWDIQDIRDRGRERCLNVLGGDVGWIWSISLSSDGTTVASANDLTVDLWDVSTGRRLSALKGHTGRVRCVAFKPDSKIVVSGSEDKTIRLWDAKTEECLGILEGHQGCVRCLTFDPTSQHLASSSDDKTIRIWDGATQVHIATLTGHTHWVDTVSFTPDGKTLISGSEDQTLKFWAVKTGHCLRTVYGYTQLLDSVAFHPDGRHLASGGNDQLVRLWDIQTGQCLKTLRGHTNLVRSVVFSPNGKILASGSNDHNTCLWDIDTGRCIYTLTGHTDKVWSVAFSPDGKIVASGSEDGKVRLYRTATGKLLKILQGTSQLILSVAFSPDSEWLAAGNDDATIDLWNVHTWDTMHPHLGKKHTSKIWSVAFSPDSQILTSGGEDGTVGLWDVKTGQHLRQLKGHAGIVRSLAFNASGTLLASASDDNTARIWDVRSGQNLFTLTEHRNQVRSVAISPNAEQLLASCSYDGTIRLWKSQTGEPLRVLNIDRPYERMDITATTGLTDDEKAMLMALGAIDREMQVESL